MINPLLTQPIGFTARQTTQGKPVQSTDNQPAQEKKKNKIYKYALCAISLIALGTTAGMIYFARRNGKLNKDLFKGICEGNKTSTPTSKFYDQTTTPLPFNPNDGYKTSTVAKPKWEITSTGDVNPPRQPQQQTRPQWQTRPQRPIPVTVETGIHPGIKKNLEEYLKTCEEGKINPEKVDKILTEAVGEKNVTERPFRSTTLHERGRKKIYQSPDGKTYVLETHTIFSKNVTRVYIEDSDKAARAYLFPDGTFKTNAFVSEGSHFTTTSKGIRWMEKSRYLNNGAA